MDKLINLCVTENLEEEAKIRKMLSNEEYITWLCERLKQKKRIISVQFYGVSLEEKRLNQLELFFGIIEEYATKNYLDACINNSGEYYNVIHDGVLFSIGKRSGEHDNFYAEIKEGNDLDAIRFSDVLLNRKTNGSECKRNCLIKIEYEISKLKLLGMSDERITAEIGNILVKRKNNE